jgi:hypothetical protein
VLEVIRGLGYVQLNDEQAESLGLLFDDEDEVASSNDDLADELEEELV